MLQRQTWLGTIGFQSTDIGNTYSVGPIAGLIAPFVCRPGCGPFFLGSKSVGHPPSTGCLDHVVVRVHAADCLRQVS